MKTTQGKPITPQQLRALHACFRSMGFDDDDRHGYLYQYTAGRVSSTKELTFEEARNLLSSLLKKRQCNTDKKAKSLCKSIYALSFRISFLNKNYSSDTEDEFRMNVAKINMFCRARSRFRKNMTQMDVAELEAVKKQLEKIANKENNSKVR